MSDHLISPDGSVVLGGKTYPLDGSFRTLKAIQHAFHKDIIDVQADALTMRFEDLARLFSLGIEGAGMTPPPPDDVEREIVEEIGILDARYAAVRWLALAIAPKRDRKKKADALAAAVALMRGEDSHGPSTRSSPSASSGGRRRRSGRATPGK